MYERTYGSRYEKDRDVKEVARVMRTEVAAHKKAGTLPGDWRYSVRCERCTHQTSIEIVAMAPRPICALDPRVQDWQQHPETGEWVHGWADCFTVEARQVRDTLTEIHAAHNHDGSEAQTDYFDRKFLGGVQLATAAGVPEWPTALQDTVSN